MPSPLLPVAVAALLGAAAPPADPAPAPASSGEEAGSSEAPGEPAARAGAADAAARPAGGRSWFAFPVVFWLPETKLGIAGAAGVHFHVGKGAGASNAFLVTGYTLLKQWTVDLASDVALRGGTLLTGRLRFAYYPDTYYGIGPETTLAQREDLTRRFAETVLTAELPVARRVRLGPRLHARAEEILDATPGGQIATGAVPGADGFRALGLGLELVYDSRDDPLWTTRGAFVEAWYLAYPGSIGHDSGFHRGSAEGRYFLSLPHGRVLGFAALLEHADAATPFSILPKIGSTRYLRGIRDGRFRDAIAWATQAELRVPLSEKLAATAFAAVGDVAPSLAGMDWDTLKVAGGLGLRYRLTGQGANLRVDTALSGEGGVELYVLLLEAF